MSEWARPGQKRQPGTVAKFPDECPRCGLPIHPGQRVILRRLRRRIHVLCASGGDDE